VVGLAVLTYNLTKWRRKMSYSKADYYAEYLSDCFTDFKIEVTNEQLHEIAEGLLISIDCESQAFYTPPASDRYAEIDREWKQKYDALRKEFDKYVGNAENAIKKALRQPSDANVGIGEYGEVTRYDGRSTQIQ